MNDEASEDRPWTEAQWEELMRKSDVRSAKFGELLETFHDHPDRDEIIAREMGWNRDEAEDEDEPIERSDSDQVSDEESEGIRDEEWEEMSEEEWEEIRRRDEEALHAIPAYSRGYKWGLKVHQALKDFLEAEELEPDDPLVEAFSNSLIVAAKIAGGHGMGYDEDALCGNIVCCKRSLEAAEKSVAALETLAEEGPVPAEMVRPLLEEGREIRALVEQHIAELRARVWWE